MDSKVPYSKSQYPAADTEEAIRIKSLPFRELIGTLLWVANGTRPDIAYAVGTLAKFTNNRGKTLESAPTGSRIPWSVH